MPQTSQQASRTSRVRTLLTPSVLGELRAAALVALLSLVFAGAVMQIWDADLNVPFQYKDDGNLNQLVIKSVLEHGWYQENADLGAPYGMELYDFPVVAGDNLSVAVVKLLGLFSSDAAVVMNLFFLLTFPLIALSAYLSMRLLGLSRRIAVVCSVLYSLIPYHFERGEIHLWLGAYYGVPLGAFLALAVLTGRPLFTPRDSGRGPLRWASSRSLLVLAACAVVASAQVYFAAFTVIFVVCAAFLAFFVRRDRGAVAAAAVVVAAVSVVTLLHHLPTILYRADHGRDAAIERHASDSERFGLKVVRMVLPVQGHRLAPLAKATERYSDADVAQIYEGPAQALGLAGSIGFLWLMWLAVSATVRSGRGPPQPLARPLATLTLLAVLVASVGGASAFFSYFVSSEIRSWARMVVFIAFFSLLGFGLLLERIARLRAPTIGAALLAAVLVLGVLDQTSTRFAPDYEATAAEYAEEGGFVKEIQHRLPPGAAVFELPYVPFPEPQLTHFEPPLNAGPYEMARGYLHSTSLEWSYGVMKGRHRDWQGRLVQLPLALVLPALAAVDFQGIYVDGAAYEDGGARVIGDLAKALGTQPLNSSRGRFAFFDLRAYTKTLGGPRALAALRRAALSPVFAEHGPGLGPEESADSLVLSRRVGPRSTLYIVNTGAEPRGVQLVLRMQSGDGPLHVQIDYPDGAKETADAPESQEKRITREFTVPPGRHPVVLTTEGASVLLIEPRAVDAALGAVAPGPTPFAPPARLNPFGLG